MSDKMEKEETKEYILLTEHNRTHAMLTKKEAKELRKMYKWICVIENKY